MRVVRLTPLLPQLETHTRRVSETTVSIRLGYRLIFGGISISVHIFCVLLCEGTKTDIGVCVCVIVFLNFARTEIRAQKRIADIDQQSDSIRKTVLRRNYLRSQFLTRLKYSTGLRQTRAPNVIQHLNFRMRWATNVFEERIRLYLI